MNTKSQRTCKNGHQYYKSSDCPVCPICEDERKPNDLFLAKLSAPARRALHGMGPATIPRLKEALQQNGLDFKS